MEETVPAAHMPQSKRRRPSGPKSPSPTTCMSLSAYPIHTKCTTSAPALAIRVVPGDSLGKEKPTKESAARAGAILSAEKIGQLLDALTSRGFEVVGPTLRDGAIVYDRIVSRSDLPAGWTDEQEAAHYRLERREDQALFGYSVGPQSWKKY